MTSDKQLAVTALLLAVGCGSSPAVGDVPPALTETPPDSLAPSPSELPQAKIPPTLAFEVGPPEVKGQPARGLRYERLRLEFDVVRRADAIPPSWISALLLCVDGQRTIAASTQTLRGVQKMEVDKPRQARMDFLLPDNATNLRCELGLFHRSRTSTERIGNWCIEDDRDSARACPSAISRPAPAKPAAMRTVDFEMESTQVSDGSWWLRYRLEYVVGALASSSNESWLIASCQTPSGLKADADRLEPASAQAMARHPGETGLFNSLLLTGRVLDAAPSQCELRFVESPAAWSASSRVIQRMCWRDGTITSAPCSEAPKTTAPREMLQASSLRVRPSLHLHEESLYLYVDIAPTRGVQYGRLLADVKCEDGDDSWEESAERRTHVHLLEPGETERVGIEPNWKKEFDRIPEYCKVTLSAEPKPRPWATPEAAMRSKNPVPLGTTCFSQGKVVPCAS